jgi:hypothetical protein
MASGELAARTGGTSEKVVDEGECQFVILMHTTAACAEKEGPVWLVAERMLN